MNTRQSNASARRTRDGTGPAGIGILHSGEPDRRRHAPRGHPRRGQRACDAGHGLHHLAPRQHVANAAGRACRPALHAGAGLHGSQGVEAWRHRPGQAHGRGLARQPDEILHLRRKIGLPVLGGAGGLLRLAALLDSASCRPVAPGRRPRARVSPGLRRIHDRAGRSADQENRSAPLGAHGRERLVLGRRPRALSTHAALARRVPAHVGAGRRSVRGLHGPAAHPPEADVFTGRARTISGAARRLRPAVRTGRSRAPESRSSATPSRSTSRSPCSTSRAFTSTTSCSTACARREA